MRKPNKFLYVSDRYTDEECVEKFVEICGANGFEVRDIVVQLDTPYKLVSGYATLIKEEKNL